MSKKRRNKTKVENSTKVAKRANGGSNFDAAGSLPFLSHWTTAQANINKILRSEGSILKSRARDAARNNPTVASYLGIVRDNVVGPSGIVFDAYVQTTSKGETNFNASDTKRIKDAFNEFQSSVTVDGLDYVGFMNAVCDTLEIEGEVFIQIILDKKYKSGISFKFIEAARMPTDFNGYYKENIIRSSIEYDEFDRPVAYWPWKYEPNDELRKDGNVRIRIPAEKVIHLYKRTSGTQQRGYTILTPVLLTLEQINQYIESELVGANVSASTMGFIKPDPTLDIADFIRPDQYGNMQLEIAPGSFVTLPPNFSVEKFDTSNPNNNLEAFVRTLLQIASAALGVTYHSISGNMDSGSGSALRFGRIREIDTFKSKQKFLQRNLCQRIYDEWWNAAYAVHPVISGLPFFREQDYKSAAIWLPKTFDYIDPTKDTAAKMMLLEANVISVTQLITELGRSPDEVFAEIKREQDKLKKLGIIGKTSQLASEIVKNDVLKTDNPGQNQ